MPAIDLLLMKHFSACKQWEKDSIKQEKVLS